MGSLQEHFVVVVVLSFPGELICSPDRELGDPVISLGFSSSN